MQRMIWILMTLSWLAACRFDPSGIPAEHDANTGCRNTCKDEVVHCDEDGTEIVCPLGCSDTDGAHCLGIVPSNGANDTHLVGVTAGLAIHDGELGTIDSDGGSIVVEGDMVRQSMQGGLNEGIGFHLLSSTISVLAVNSLSIEQGGTLRVSGGRGLIILSSGDVMIDGLIDISGGCDNDVSTCGGPGGGDGATNTIMASGCGPGGNGEGKSGGEVDETGGGGGALGAEGAPGGDGEANGSNVSEPGGAGGVISDCPDETLIPLVGGSGGGMGGASSGSGGNGGGGGGALQITSKTVIAFMRGGGIWAGGAGGASGGSSEHDDGGGGGGSGGAILLEAPEVKAAGAILTANGGGGGGGRHHAESGVYGTHDTMQAAGGAGGDGNGNYGGGSGGAFDGPAQSGMGGGDGTGGGGGGVGIIRINVPADKLDITNAIISPAHTRGGLAVQ